MADFTPFADDSAALTIGDFNAENHPDKVVLFGTLDITRDKEGLAKAKALASLLRATVAALKADKALPDRIEQAPARVETTRNPFS